MPRISRVDVGGEVYHVLNRANARVQIFDTETDYLQFEEILIDAVLKYDMRLLSFCVMPNHWHLALYPKSDGDLQRFMGWLANTHTRRWHVAKKTVGQGHLYQGRYKSFLCEQDRHLFTVLRYIERNAKTANLIPQAELWRWSSVWWREYGTTEQKKALSQWPIPMLENYLQLLNEPLSRTEEEKLSRSEEKNIPFGKDEWVGEVVKKYGIEQVIRRVGRPKNGD